MGIEELALLVALAQFATVAKLLLQKAGPASTNPWAKWGAAYGAQLAANVATAAAAGVVAATAEFNTRHTEEAQVALVLNALPPIS